MKIRSCVVCSLDMQVPNNSGKKYCPDCAKKRNKDKVKEWYHAQPRECRKKAGERQALKKLKDISYRLYTRARARATQQNLEFDITPDDIIVPDVCPILHTPFTYKTYYTASLDRIDSNRGYTKDNIQVMSHKANAMKNSASKEELIKFADWIYKIYK